MTSDKKSQRILIIKLDSVGEVLLTTPVITALRQVYPESQLSYLVGDEAKDVVQDHPDLDQTFVFPTSRFNRLKQEKRIFSAWQAIKPVKSKLQAIEFDLVVDLEATLFSALFTFFASAERKIGRKKLLTSWLYNQQVPVQTERHLVEEYCSLLHKTDNLPTNYQPECTLAIGDRDRDYINRLLAKYDIEEEEKVVAFNLTAKEWPLEKYVAVGNWITNHLAAKIILLGSSTKDQVSKISNQITGKVVDFTKETEVKKVAALVQQVDLLVTEADDLMHLATAVDIPLLALFGAGNADRWGPYQGRNLVVKSPSGDLADIRVEMVTNHLNLMLDWE